MKQFLRLSIALIFLTGCAGGWTEEDKTKLHGECMEQSRRQIPEAQATKYCDCFVEGMVRTYPVFNDVMEHYQSDTVEKLKAHCRQDIGMQ